MRIKTLLGLAAFAVGAATCVAQQNVYSVNIVGYVNVPLEANRLNLISNPLKPSDGNYQITNTIVLPSTVESALVYKWAGDRWSSTTPEWFGEVSEWSESLEIGLGESFFIRPSSATTVTFVGEVATGEVTGTIPTGISFIANKVPLNEGFPGQAVGNEGDLIYIWDTANQSWGTTWEYFGAEVGWFPSAGAENPAGPVLAPGSGVAYNNKAAAINWTRTFNP